MPTTTHQVVVAGAGPTGMVLAAELAIAGIDVLIVERRETPDLESSRSGGLHARTLEVLDQRGVLDRFLDAGTPMQVQGFAMIPLDISDLPVRRNHGLALWQREFEPLLADWVAELGVPTLRGRAVVGLTQDGDGVDVRLDDDTVIRAEYLVGCDGGRSTVRTAAGIDVVGLDPRTSWLVAEFEVDIEPPPGLTRDEHGFHGGARLGEGQPVRMLLTERELRTDEATLEDLRAALVAVYGTDFGAHDPRWVSRFTDAARQADTYRAGRVLIAGDAAHVHPPQGGQGLNTGVQDAVNLGWKLAQVVRGTSPGALLDSYQDERHPVAARVLQNTSAQVALTVPSGRHADALRTTMAELLAMDEPRRRIAGMITALDVAYDMGQGHPLLGRRMPDLDLTTTEGPTRVFALLHEARPVLLDLSDVEPDLGAWSARVRHVDASHDGIVALPVIGEVEAPAAVLIRPDGHVAWVSDGSDTGLEEALTTWFGPA